jgi:hypothetical protein
VREDYATNLLAPCAAAISPSPSPPSPDTRTPQPDLRITDLATDPMALATSPDHSRASRDQIPLTQRRDELMVALVGSVALTV